MCGIAGFSGPGDRSTLETMTNSLVHRGPDAYGYWENTEKSIFLGHRRLSILDHNGGSQPMWDWQKQYCIVFNGEIYNYKELRSELSSLGHRFITDHSDTEVVLEAFKCWGKDFVNKLNGMWAFAIYNTEQNTLFLSRDRFGKKPLYYFYNKSTFAFASELSSVKLHPSAPASISRLALKKFFAYSYIPAPLSLYEGIYKLPAGYNLSYNCSIQELKLEKYWQFDIEPYTEIPANAEKQWSEQIIHLLSKAVQRRLAADVPVGVFLSGGIDSSAIAALASKHMSGVKTFSIGFEEDTFDESFYAELVAKSLGTEHYNTILSIEKALEILPEVSKHLDEPMGDSSILPTYLLSAITKKHVTVALGGDGADELFAGYDPYKSLKYARLLSSIVPKPLHRGVLFAASFLPTSHDNISLDYKVKNLLKGISHPEYIRNAIWLGALTPHELKDLFQEPVNIEEIYEEAINAWESCTQKNVIDRMLCFYTRVYLQNDILTKIDRASMLNSLELRAPFLDIDLVNLVRKIPHQFKYRNGQGKYILKKALEPYLPMEILYRSKQGFGAPIGKWIRNGHININPSNAAFPHNNTFVQSLLKEHRSGKADHKNFLWNWYLLEKTLH